MSRAGAEWVSAPSEMKSTPDSATAAMFSSVIPPLASVSAPRARGAMHGRREVALAEVVQEDGSSAGLQRLVELVERPDLYLDGGRRPGRGQGGADGVGERLPTRPRGGDVVVFDPACRR